MIENQILAQSFLNELLREGNKGFVWTLDCDSGFFEVDPQWLARQGVADGLQKEGLTRLIFPEDLARVLEALQRLVDGESDIFHCKHRIQTPLSGTRWCISHGVISRPPTQQRMIISGASLLMEIEANEQQMQDEKDFLLRSTLNAVEGAVLSLDEHNRIIYANTQAEELLNWPGGHFQAGVFLKQALSLEALADDANALEFLEPVDGGTSTLGQFVVVWTDGTQRLTECSTTPIRTTNGDLVSRVVTIRDISEQELIRGEILNNAGISAIGHLAGGVAHDFNNMLAGIMGAGEVLNCSLQHTLSTGDKEFLQIILDNCREAGELSSRLSTLSRRGISQPQAIDVHALIKDVAKTFALTLPVHIKLEYELACETHWVNGDTVELHNAILNVLVNAAHAMPDGGVVKLSTSNVDIERSSVSDTGLEAGLYLQLDIQDNGVGIPTSLHNRVFEPYFTTKEPGRGTGLGLAAMRATIAGHKGRVTFYSVEGSGTTFQIMLPTTSPVLVQRELETQKERAWKILVVDDELSARATLVGMLETVGCKCIVASDGHEGIDMFEKHNHELDAVLLDIFMPVTSGDEVYQHMHVINSHCPVIAMSGYLTIETMHVLKVHGIGGFLYKPFSRSHLLETLSDVIGNSSEQIESNMSENAKAVPSGD